MPPTPPYILAIESSCDETAVALVDAAGRVAVNAVASQAELHARYGGVVPEVASRRHLEAILPLLDEAMAAAEAGWDDVRALAVTRAPGLIGCLLIGVETAKALAWARGKPLIAVHHLRAHLHAPFLVPEKPALRHLLAEGGAERAALPPAAGEGWAAEGTLLAVPDFPHAGLIVSGGHTSLAIVEAPGRCRTIATTRDDAAGEAYDKVARILGAGFPGGPVIDRLAAQGDPSIHPFTAPMRRRGEHDFSFSGLKSAVARKVEAIREANGGAPPGGKEMNDLCASFQKAVIDSLLEKSLDAAREHGAADLVVAGGVAANRGLRRAALAASASSGVRIWFPNMSLCGDNAAMIAGLAWHLPELDPAEALELNPVASAPLD